MALGAHAGNVSGLVLGEGLAAVGSGVLLGLVAAAFLSRFPASLLHGVRPLDPATYLAVVVSLAAVSVAAGSDPAIALRND